MNAPATARSDPHAIGRDTLKKPAEFEAFSDYRPRAPKTAIQLLYYGIARASVIQISRLSHTVTHLLRTPQFCRYGLTISTEFEKSQKLPAASNKSITHV